MRFFRRIFARLFVMFLFVYSIYTLVDQINEKGTLDKEINNIKQTIAEQFIDSGEPQQQDDVDSTIDDIETAEIVHISDGDTITVLLNGNKEKVRMLEVDTPESVHSDKSKNTTFGKTASEYTKSNLKEGQTVYLTKDISDRDRYDRLLRLMWTEKPTDPFDETELRNKCYNAKLLLDGYAEVAIFDDKSYQTIFTKFQEEAMQDRRGLWADDAWWEFNGLK